MSTHIQSISSRAGLAALLVLSVSSVAAADEIFVVSPTTALQRGNPFTGDLPVVGACGGAAQSAARNGTEVLIGDVGGRIYRYDLVLQSQSYAFDAPNDAKALEMHNGNLLSGGSNATVARLNPQTGAVLGSLNAPVAIEAMFVSGNALFIGGGFGQIWKGDALAGNFQAMGVCGGAVNSMTSDGTNLFVGSSDQNVYVFDATTGAFVNIFGVGNDATSVDLHMGDLLVSGSDSTLERRDRATGALKKSFGTSFPVGDAVVIDEPDPGVEYCFGVGCPCGNDDASAGCKSSFGWGSRLATRGSASVGADDLVITAYLLPTAKAGRFYMSGNTNNVPFGDGFLCAGNQGYPIFRFPIQNSDFSNAYELTGIVAYAEQNFPVSGHITAGSTWHFQGWTRDPQGPCGSTFNTTSAVSVTFVP